MKKDFLKIANRKFKSRLIVGTGKYKDMSECAKAVKLSGAEIVTVAVRRVNIENKNKPLLMDYLNPKKIIYEEEKPQYVSMKRGLKASVSLTKGTVLKREHINVLRPCQEDTVPADKLSEVIGKTISVDIEINKPIKIEDIK